MDQEENEDAGQRPKKRLFRFGLRSLFVLTLVACLVALGLKWRHENMVAKKRQWLLRHGGNHAALIEDGDLILVRNQHACCAIVVSSQKHEPERMEYDWYLRTDGLGKLFADNPAVHRGSATTCGPTSDVNVQIGPFDLQWSGGDEGFGWFYFPIDPNVEFCVMRARHRRSIDVMTNQWKFKSRKDKPADSPINQDLINLLQQDAI